VKGTIPLQIITSKRIYSARAASRRTPRQRVEALTRYNLPSSTHCHGTGWIRGDAPVDSILDAGG